MGIKNLTKLIGKYKKSVTISAFKGFKFALDVSNFMYIYKTCSKSEFEYFIRMIQLYLKCKSNDIDLIFIFDGKPPEIKKEELEKREIIKNKINAPDERDFKIMKLLCKICAIPYMTSISESEMLSSALFYNDHIDGVISRDTDHLVYGIGYMITKISVSDFNHNIEYYDLNEILSELSLSYMQFVSMCVISGCDYSKRIRNIGIKRSYQFFQKYNSIYEFLKQESEYIKKNKPDVFRPIESFKIFVKKYKLKKSPKWSKSIIISSEQVEKILQKYFTEIGVIKLHNIWLEHFI